MRPARVAAIVLAVCAAILAGSATVCAQGMILQIEISGSNPEPAAPTAPIDNIRDLSRALARCWTPPPLNDEHQPLDVTFQVSFKRNGDLFGKPNAVLFSREITQQERARYYQAVAEAVERCWHMPFTESMGGAVAGRTFRVNFLDRRKSKKAGVSWQRTKTG